MAQKTFDNKPVGAQDEVMTTRRNLIASAALALSALALGACGGGSKHATIDYKINGTTITTTPAAQCQAVKDAQAAFASNTAGMTAWNALPQSARDAARAGDYSNAPVDRWLAQHGYSAYTSAQQAIASAVTVGCPR